MGLFNIYKMKVLKPFYLHSTKKSYQVGDEFENPSQKLIDNGYVEAPKKEKELKPKRQTKELKTKKSTK